MSKLKGKGSKVLASVLALLFIVSAALAGAFFTDRVSHQMQFTIAAFMTEDGYGLVNKAPKGPFVANEDVEFTLTETNKNGLDVNSTINMSVEWISPDTSSRIFGNANAADNATITISGENISYTVNGDNTIGFVIPEHLLKANTDDNDLKVTFHIPDSLMATGELAFSFNSVTVTPVSGGTALEYSAEDINAEQELDFKVKVGWAAAKTTAWITSEKAIMGYLTGGPDTFGISYEMAMNYDSAAMKDFTSATQSRWSHYKDKVTSLSFPTTGITAIGDYDFASFTKVTSITIPSSVTNIGTCAFDGSGLEGELTIPATVLEIESLAFGHLPKVDTVTFEHTKLSVFTDLLPDNESAGNKEKGAFYLPPEDFVETTVNSGLVDIKYGYSWHNDNRRAIPTLNAQDTWFRTYTGDWDYTTPVEEDALETITLVDYYMPDGTESATWDASDPSVPGTVTAYLSEDGKSLIIAGNGYGLIFANEDSSGAFSGLTAMETFANADLLDTRNTTDMYYMYGYCPMLTNIDVSTWNVSLVEDMSSMFYACDSLVSMDLSKNTCEAKDGSGEYEAWHTTSLKYTGGMFMDYGGPNFSLTSVDVTDWDTSKLEETTYMFMDCRGLTEIIGIEDWDVSGLKIANNMFQACYSLEEIDVSEWNTSSLEESSVMFGNCYNLKGIDISGWDMSNVTDSSGMFIYCESFTELTIPESLTKVGERFAAYCPNLTTINFNHDADADIDFPTPGYYDGAFLVDDNGLESDSADYVQYTPVKPLGTKVVTNNQKVLDYGWATDSRGYVVEVEIVTGGTLTAAPTVTHNGKKATVAINGKTITFTATPTPNTDYVFDGATIKYSVNGVEKTEELDTDTMTFVMPFVDDNFDTADVIVTPRWRVDAIPMLAKQDSWQYLPDQRTEDGSTPIDFTLLQTINIVDTYTPAAGETSWDASAYETVDGVDYMGKVTAHLSADKKTLTIAGNGYGCIFANPDSQWAMTAPYSGMEALTRINGAETLETKLVTNAGGMFSMNGNLEYVNVSDWNTSKIQYTNANGYYGMFMNCRKLQNLDVATKTINKGEANEYTAWDTGSMIEMYEMFSNCELLTTIDVSGWDTSSCQHMGYMFSNTGISNITVNGDGWNTSELVYSYGMFADCKNLTDINLSTWNVGKLEDTSEMFKNSGLESIDLSAWDESIVSSTYSMFEGCTALTDVNIVGWNLSNLNTVTTDTTYDSSFRMFYGCTSLEELTIPASLKVFARDFARDCTSLTTIEFLHDESAADFFFATPGSNYGAFYVDTPYTETAPLRTKVITDNQTVLDYGWTKDHRGYTVTVATVTGGTMSADPTVSINGKTITLKDITPVDKKVYDGATVSYTDESGTAQTMELDAKTTQFTMPTSDVTITPKWADPPIPMLDEKQTWYKGSVDKHLVTSITLMNTYAAPTDANGAKMEPVETWDASAYQTVNGTPYMGKVTGYLFEDNSVIIAGNGCGEIFANPNSAGAFEMGAKVSNKITSNLTSLSGLNFLNTTETMIMSNMFQYCSALTSLDVSGFDTSKVTHMDGMFHTCSSLTSLDVSGFDTSMVETMKSMFYNCKGLPTLNVSKFNTSRVTNMSYMFYGCIGLTGPGETALDVSGFVTDKVQTMTYMFYNCSGLTSLDVSGFVTSSVTAMNDMFYNCSGLTSLDVSNFDTTNNKSMSNMFRACKKLTTLDVSGFVTSNVTSMANAFQECSGLTTLDVSGFVTSNVKDMSSMFHNCTGLTSLDVSKFVTSNVTKLNQMFYGCKGLSVLDVSGFDTSKVTQMGGMFASCSGLTSLDVSGFDTSNVTWLSFAYSSSNQVGLFEGCSKLNQIDLSGFDLSNVVYAGDLFRGCSTSNFTIYVKDENDADFVKSTTSFPSTATVVVKAAAAALSLDYDETTGTVSGYSVKQ